MKTPTLLKTGIIGMAVAALCCFTPLLIVLFGSVGLAGWVGHLDAVLVPALVVFILITIYAFIRQDREAKQASGAGEK